jgi:hypothetical protein
LEFAAAAQGEHVGLYLAFGVDVCEAEVSHDDEFGTVGLLLDC